MSEFGCNCKCGSKDLFMRRKGTQIGLYCVHCGAWVKWVGKKDAEGFERLGYPIYDEKDSMANGGVGSEPRSGSAKHSCDCGCSSVKEELSQFISYLKGEHDRYAIQAESGSDYAEGRIAAYKQVIEGLKSML